MDINLRLEVASLNRLCYDGKRVHLVRPGGRQGGRRCLHSVAGPVVEVLFLCLRKTEAVLHPWHPNTVDPFLHILFPERTSEWDVESEKNNRWSLLILPRL